MDFNQRLHHRRFLGIFNLTIGTFQFI